MTSVIIPARNEPYLQQTVSSLLEGATGPLEIVVVLDGWWPSTPLTPDPRVVTLHHSEARGLREAVNLGASVARGTHLMKVDAHCLFNKGYDSALIEHTEEGWVACPSRYSLDAEKWERGYGPLEYLYLTYPYSPDAQYGEGLHGKKWCGPTGLGTKRPEDYYYLERQRASTKIDDIQAFQGSCWFLSKQTFEDIGPLDSRFGTFYQEPQEVAFKAFLRGGRVVINKHTWYAHWHKTIPQGYGFSKNGKHRDMRYSTWYWMNNQWPRATRPIEDFIQFHWPIPGWPDNWREEKEKFEAANPCAT